jgi:hypothetical protein
MDFMTKKSQFVSKKKRKKPDKLNKHTKKFLKDLGHVEQTVEMWIPQAKRFRDLFGFIDTVAMHPDIQGLIGVQTTSVPNMEGRRRKIVDDPRVKDKALMWLKTGNHIWILGWHKTGEVGKRQLWRHELIVIKEEHFTSFI